MWRLTGVHLFVLLLLNWAVTIVCDEVKEKLPNIVFFPSREKPRDVELNDGFFARGLHSSNGKCYSVYDHIMKPEETESCTVYLSLTPDIKKAASWLTGSGGYVYKVHALPNMFPVLSTLGLNTDFLHEDTILAMGRIRFEQIMAWTEITQDKDNEISPENADAPWNHPRTNWEPNYSYKPLYYEDAEMSPGQPQLAGYPADHPSYAESETVARESKPDNLEAAGEEFMDECVQEHSKMTTDLEIDKKKSKLRPFAEMRKNLKDFMHRKGTITGLDRVPLGRRLKGTIFKSRGRISMPRGRFKKAMMPGFFEFVGAAYEVYRAFSQDSSVLTRVAAVTSCIPVVQCGTEYLADEEEGEGSVVDFAACLVGDILLFTRWAPMGMVINLGRLIGGKMSSGIKEDVELRVKLIDVEEMKQAAKEDWNDMCNNMTAYLESSNFTDIHHDQFLSEIFALEMLATEGLSVLETGYTLLLADSSSDEERERIQRSYAHGATRLHVRMCDEIDVKKQSLTEETQATMKEWMRAKALDFEQTFFQEWNATALRSIAKIDGRFGLHEVTVTKKIYEWTLQQNLARAFSKFKAKVPDWNIKNLTIPKKTMAFCARARAYDKRRDQRQPVEEANCYLSNFWDHDRLNRLHSGTLRCKLDDRSYGLDRLFLTSCPLQAPKRSLNCTEKPVSVLDIDDFRLIEDAGIDRSLIEGGEAGASSWKPPEVWKDAPKNAGVDCKGKKISWSFYSRDVLDIADGRLRCLRSGGRPWETMRWVNRQMVEVCRSVNVCKTYASIEDVPFEDNPRQYGFPVVPPPAPWKPLLLDCKELNVSWTKFKDEPDWLQDHSRRVAEGLDRCGVKAKGSKYWLQWHPKWSNVQREQDRVYSSLVEYVDGKPGRRLDLDGSQKQLDQNFLKEAAEMGMPTEPPPEKQEISGIPWNGTRPETSIVCLNPEWELNHQHEPDDPRQRHVETDDLRQNLIANGLVSCGHHGWDQTWHWAEEGSKLVRCKHKTRKDHTMDCVYWHTNLDFMSLDAVNDARSFLIPTSRPPPVLLSPKVKAGLEKQTDSNLLELVAPESVDGCARISDLTYKFKMGSGKGDQTDDLLSLNFGNSEWIHLNHSGKYGYEQKETITDLRHVFREGGHLDRNGNLYLKYLDHLQIWEDGVPSLFDGAWGLTDLRK
ncbi:hypothetical protein CP533_5212 [Ophiocordyceps camponoti-saundersi (nom. inval.)]|nr:hypothetical protein CP533_5212 [Ophiocordyceps camponoti-saundersi (nom. inval.)]